jgi:hypothetical protein
MMAFLGKLTDDPTMVLRSKWRKGSKVGEVADHREHR